MIDDLKHNTRVYILLVHNVTQEEKRRYGTVQGDPIPGWDYVNVKFDDFPAMSQPILSYYLYPDALAPHPAPYKSLQKGVRIYIREFHPITGQEQRRPGAVETTALNEWDNVAVRFDQTPDQIDSVPVYGLYLLNSSEAGE